MKARYRTKGNRMEFEIEGTTLPDIFRGISEVQEVFEADSVCGKCGKENLRFQVVKNFYKLSCKDCGANLEFIKLDDGRIFAKRKTKDGKPMENHGWHIWTGQRSQPSASSEREEEIPY